MHRATSAFAGVMLRVGFAETDIVHRPLVDGSVVERYVAGDAAPVDSPCDQQVCNGCHLGLVGSTNVRRRRERENRCVMARADEGRASRGRNGRTTD
jgi:hypothetical protein